MRASEAMWLSDPKHPIDKEHQLLITHLDIKNKPTWEEILEARKRNRTGVGTQMGLWPDV